MPFYPEMSKNITQQRDIYDKVIFRLLQIFYGLLDVSLLSYIYIYIYIYYHYVLFLENLLHESISGEEKFLPENKPTRFIEI